jgi:hypothetical protein
MGQSMGTFTQPSKGWFEDVSTSKKEITKKDMFLTFATLRWLDGECVALLETFRLVPMVDLLHNEGVILTGVFFAQAFVDPKVGGFHIAELDIGGHLEFEAFRWLVVFAVGVV